MATTTQHVKRVFLYEGTQLPDPGHDKTPDQVKQFYAATYPALLNGKIDVDDSKQMDGEIIYKLKGLGATKG